MWQTFECAGVSCSILEHGTPKQVFLWPYSVNMLEELDAMEEAVSDFPETMNFAIAAFQMDDWDAQLSPWEAENAFGADDFSGNADETLNWLSESYLPVLKEKYPASEKYYAIGYSLAGLFGLWSLYVSDLFDGCACCSGSLWIEEWDTFVSEHKIRKESMVYLSLGGKEEKTGNYIMARVGDRTRMQDRILKADPMVKASTLEWNSGGHFADTIGRMCKGLNWILKRN